MAEGLYVMFTHHQPDFLVMIRITVEETVTAPLGVCLETCMQENKLTSLEVFMLFRFN